MIDVDVEDMITLGTGALFTGIGIGAVNQTHGAEPLPAAGAVGLLAVALFSTMFYFLGRNA